MGGTYDPPERNDDQKDENLKAGEEVRNFSTHPRHEGRAFSRNRCFAIRVVVAIAINVVATIIAVVGAGFCVEVFRGVEYSVSNVIMAVSRFKSPSPLLSL